MIPTESTEGEGGGKRGEERGNRREGKGLEIDGGDDKK